MTVPRGQAPLTETSPNGQARAVPGPNPLAQSADRGRARAAGALRIFGQLAARHSQALLRATPDIGQEPVGTAVFPAKESAPGTYVHK